MMSWDNAPAKAKTFVKYPKLEKIENKDGSTRVHILDVPQEFYVHDLRTPKIENGRLVYKIEKGEVTDEVDTVWLASAICLGDQSTLSEKGKDTQNCPACKFANDNPDMLFKPKRNLVGHVWQYKTNGGKNPVKGTTGSLVTWKYYDKTYTVLRDAHDDFKDQGGISGIDFVLTLAGPVAFQKYDVAASPQNYAEKPEFKAAIEAAWIDENKCQDLKGQCGRTIDRADYEEHLARIKRDHLTKGRLENGDNSPMDLTNAPNVATPSMKDNMDALLGNDTKKKSEDKSEAPDMNALIGTIDF